MSTICTNHHFDKGGQFKHVQQYNLQQKRERMRKVLFELLR
jgi:hypothetical protein